MASVPLRTLSGTSPSGNDAGTVDLDEQMFGIQPNVPVLHQVVTAQLAARRAGTQSTKTRAEVRGGGRKPFKQKGTGNARQGSIRAPHFSGGGVALGPKPRKYDQRTPKKMIKLALRSALSDRAAEGKVIVLDRWAFDAPSTKAAKAALTSLGIESGALVVVDRNDENTIKSFLNLQEVQLIERGELNAYDILCNEWLVFTRELLPTAPPNKNGAGESLVERAKDVADTVKDVVEDVVDKVGDVAGRVAGAAKAFVHGLTSDDTEESDTAASGEPESTGTDSPETEQQGDSK
jgi:large subunit ribosomal protein L4